MAENKRVSLRLAHVSKSFEKIETDEVTHALNEINLTIYDFKAGGRTDSADDRKTYRGRQDDHGAVSGKRDGFSEADALSMADCLG